ncbi:MAG: amidase [Candidatus Binataceae bacterium]
MSADVSGPGGLIAQTARALRSREFSVRDLIERQLARIEAIEPKINAFTLIDREGARSAADALDRELAAGSIRSSLHGIPITVKDLFATRGQRTAAGSVILRDNIADDDGAVIRRLREAGAVILGKTGMNEFAFGATGLNAHHGAVRNPWDLERITGGSSSGAAAATAAGIGLAALGTDTGGSVRLPAALTGVAGFKPSYERLSRDGVFPLSWSLDHVGVLARSTADIRAVLEFSTAPENRLAPKQRTDISGVRIGVIEEYCRGLDDTVGARWAEFRGALEAAGAHLESLEPNFPRLTIPCSTAIMFAEAAAVHTRWIRDRRELYGEEVRMRLLQGALIPARTYLRAHQLRRVIADEVASSFARVDWLICPTCATVADKIAEVDARTGGRVVRNTRLSPLLGIPAISIPIPSPGLPVGAQIMGAYGRDAELLNVAEAIENLIGRGSAPPAI